VSIATSSAWPIVSLRPSEAVCDPWAEPGFLRYDQDRPLETTWIPLTTLPCTPAPDFLSQLRTFVAQTRDVPLPPLPPAPPAVPPPPPPFPTDEETPSPPEDVPPQDPGETQAPPIEQSSPSPPSPPSTQVVPPQRRSPANIPSELGSRAPRLAPELEFLRDQTILLIGDSVDRNGLEQLAQILDLQEMPTSYFNADHRGETPGWDTRNVPHILEVPEIGLTVVNVFFYGLGELSTIYLARLCR
jgi:hypothetical protein